MSEFEKSKMFTGAGRDWHNRAMIGFMPGVHWFVYVNGYKEAGDRLVASIDSGQGKQDFLVFPILHLYRHWVELALKANIRASQVLLDVARPSLKDLHKTPALRAKAALGHNLNDLWDHLQTLLAEIYPDLEEEYVQNINRVARAFAALDPAGDQTRYPVKLNEDRSLQDLKEVNLRQLADDMSLAEAGFTQIEGSLDYLADQRGFDHEMMMEMQAEFQSMDWP